VDREWSSEASCWSIMDTDGVLMLLNVVSWILNGAAMFLHEHQGIK
jgi:hypothetical protein